MNYLAYDNRFINYSMVAVTLGIIAGTGSLYRYAYNYDIIMFGTLVFMVGIAYYRHFVPLSNPEYHTRASLNISKYVPGFIMVLFLIAIPVYSDVLNLVDSYQITYFHIAMVFSAYLIGEKNRLRLFDIYLKIIIVLCLISLVYFFTALLIGIPEFVPRYPILVKPNYSDFYYIWGGHINPYTLIRNQSIFWEPGAFGYHIILAMVLAYQQKKNVFIVILIITSLTTMSTTVYLFLFCLGFYQFIWGQNRLRLGLILALSVGGVLLTLWLVFDDFLLPIVVWQVLVSKFSPESSSFVSYTERALFTIEALKLFVDNLFIGAGHYATAFLEVIGHGTTNTSGLAGLMAEFGLFGVFLIFLYTRFFRIFKLMAIPIALLWLNGEFLQYSPLSLFILAHEGDRLAMRLFPTKTNHQIEKNKINESKLTVC